MNKVGDTYFPGSKVPFNPLNKHGAKAKALRPDGSIMPDDWESPLRQEVYQLYVEDADKGVIPICPKMILPIVSEWRAMVAGAIKSGQIGGWSNPHFVKAPAERAVARVF